MTDAINATRDVLGERELDAVSGGMLWLPLVAVKVREIKGGGTGGGEGGGQSDPAAQMFQQILQQLTQPG
jgi:hypothetical protein